MKRTPFYQEHLKLKAKMVEFAGYEMPIQYHSIQQEHLETRQGAGLFDVSHMGEIWIEGPQALASLQHLFSNDFRTLKPQAIRYTLLLDDTGHVLDDCLVYCFSLTQYLIVVNASNQAKDDQWIKDHLLPGCEAINRSDETAQLAIQGPLSQAILERLSTKLPEKYYHFIETEVAGVPCIVSQTGYTGEAGYELYFKAEQTTNLWKAFLDAGALPVGLGARDTLRLEAGMPLYGHEFNDKYLAHECGVNFAIKMNKEDFIGKQALTQPATRKRIGLMGQDRVIAREHDLVYQDGVLCGEITSGTFSPSLQKPIAMASVNVSVDVEKPFEVVGRRTALFTATPYPFIKK